jgi:hypothetical protein
MSNFNIIKKQIELILPKSPLSFELIHAQLVLKWVLKLKPDANEALQISAIGHDIDRAITGITEKDLTDYSNINKFKKEHGIRSANFVVDILKTHNYPEDIIEETRHLIENHEFGGDENSNILMNADSLAYFEYNIPSYLKRNGKERTKDKIKFMYNRLSPEAKKLVFRTVQNNSEISSLITEALLYRR